MNGWREVKRCWSERVMVRRREGSHSAEIRAFSCLLFRAFFCISFLRELTWLRDRSNDLCASRAACQPHRAHTQSTQSDSTSKADDSRSVFIGLCPRCGQRLSLRSRQSPTLIPKIPYDDTTLYRITQPLRHPLNRRREQHQPSRPLHCLHWHCKAL